MPTKGTQMSNRMRNILKSKELSNSAKVRQSPRGLGLAQKNTTYFRELDFINESDRHDILAHPFVTTPVIYKNIMICLTPIIRALALDTKH